MENKKFFIVLYFKNVSEKFKTITHKSKFNISYKQLNSLNRFLKSEKDKIKKEECSHIVYQINYSDYSASYVGQTKRKLNTRLKSTKPTLKKPSHTISVSQH